MAEDKSIDFLDYIVAVVKYKKLLILVVVISFILSYFSIYFLIREEFEANATFLPTEQSSVSPFSALMKDFSKLPVNLGGKSKSSNYFNTIIYSRSLMNKMIDTFKLYQDYNVYLYDEVLKELRKKVSTNETEEGAFVVNVRASSPKKAADMANYIIANLNETVVRLNSQKTHDNRVYLDKRYEEIKNNLKNSEDSLKKFQQSSGILDVEEQTKAMIENYSRLEADLASKQIEYSIISKVYGESSTQAQNAKITLDEFRKQASKIKNGESGNLLLQEIGSLPQKDLEYLRLFRNVKINNSMLEFIIPLYENAKFEEHKDVPILQVIDYAVPPQKRAYPHRALLAVGITIGVLMLLSLVIFLKEGFSSTKNEKVLYIKQNILKLKRIN